ncbi:MAG: TRAM domain-containing protein, partial [Candidatus Diapherotrites archaeon]|nr:TRAM domain-containing protein [Candidatus Diapherotrites archaeon]
MPFSKYNQKRFQKPIPVKEGDTYEVTIENLGEKGDGIAKVKGYVIIIPNVKKGERVKIKVNAIRGKVSFG